jgi:hypothetical protein
VNHPHDVLAVRKRRRSVAATDSQSTYKSSTGSTVYGHFVLEPGRLVLMSASDLEDSPHVDPQRSWH